MKVFNRIRYSQKKNQQCKFELHEIQLSGNSNHDHCLSFYPKTENKAASVVIERHYSNLTGHSFVSIVKEFNIHAIVME